MKYLKIFESFEWWKETNEYKDIIDVLQEIIDDYDIYEMDPQYYVVCGDHLSYDAPPGIFFEIDPILNRNNSVYLYNIKFILNKMSKIKTPIDTLSKFIHDIENCKNRIRKMGYNVTNKELFEFRVYLG